jgi:DNA-binding IclR family transcriptional regulator
MTAMAWGFLTNHAQALLCIANDPGVRLREIASTVGITERAAFGIVSDLVHDGYVLRERQGRRNRYSVQIDRPLQEALLRQHTVGELLALLTDVGAGNGGHVRPDGSSHHRSR